MGRDGESCAALLSQQSHTHAQQTHRHSSEVREQRRREIRNWGDVYTSSIPRGPLRRVQETEFLVESSSQQLASSSRVDPSPSSGGKAAGLLERYAVSRPRALHATFLLGEAPRHGHWGCRNPPRNPPRWEGVKQKNNDHFCHVCCHFIGMVL